MAALRTNWSRDDTSRIYDHLNSMGGIVNPFIEDTGWRDVASSNLNGGSAAWEGGVYMRRTHDLVKIQAAVSIAVGSAFIGLNRETTGVLTLPVGFAPTQFLNAAGVAVVDVINQGAFLRWEHTTRRLSVRGSSGTWAAGNVVTWSCVFPTREAFPAVYPGTAV